MTTLPFARMSELNDKGTTSTIKGLSFGSHDDRAVYYWTPSFGAEIEAILRKHFGAYASPAKVQAAIVDIEELRRKHGDEK